MDHIDTSGVTTDPVLELNALTFQYPGSERKVIDGLDLSLNHKDRVGIVAPNGSGKTTLFYLIMGLFKPNSGTVSAFGKTAKSEADFEVIRRRIGLLFQDSDDQLFSPTVLEDVAFGPLNLGKQREEAILIARETLLKLGLQGFEDRVTHKLSGGEKRLVSLATVLAMEPEVLLLDEPSNGLDEIIKGQLLALLSSLDLSYLIISHDNEFLSAITNTNFTLKHGKLAELGQLHAHYHSHPHSLSHEHSRLHHNNGVVGKP